MSIEVADHDEIAVAAGIELAIGREFGVGPGVGDIDIALVAVGGG